MPSNPTSRRGRAAVLARAAFAVVVLSVVSACGSGSSGSSGGTISIGVGGQPLLPYLPTTLAQEIGCYKKNGVDVKIEDLQAGSKALEAMIGGSTDVTSGYYDHTIQMAAKHQPVTAFVNMLRYPAIVLAVAPDSAGEISSVEDLKGKTVGVTAPGSSTDFFLKHMLKQAGLDPDAASVQAVGADATAVAAMEKGQVDAAVMLDPAFSQLEERAGKLEVLADTRTKAGVQKVFGTESYPAAVFYAKQDWIDGNKETAAKLSDSITCALDFIENHTAAEIAEKMPPQFAGDDRELYVKAIAGLQDAYNPTGKMDASGASAVRDVLAETDPAIADAKVDVSKTYTNDFLQK